MRYDVGQEKIEEQEQKGETLYWDEDLPAIIVSEGKLSAVRLLYN
jgi:hypothetical protein